MNVKKLTAKQQCFRKNLLARVHLAPIYTDYFAHFRKEYKEMLSGAFGKTSAADLTISQLSILVKFLYSKSQSKPRSVRKKISTQAQRNAPLDQHSCNVISLANNNNHAAVNTVSLIEYVTPAQAKYINTLWQHKARVPTEQALRAFIEKNFKKVVFNVNALTKKEASGLINALNRM